MQTYKRAFITLLMGIIGAPFAGMVAVMIGSFFIQSLLLLLTIGLVICAAILWVTVFSERIAFTLSEDGQFSYYKRGKLKERFDIPNCYVGYYRKSKGATDHDISLRILPVGKEESDTVTIDASPLGRNRFEKMFARLEALSANEPEVLSAAPKNQI